MCCLFLKPLSKRTPILFRILKLQMIITMKKIILPAFLLMCLLAVGCDKEKDPVPGTEPENVYGDQTLPQGNHDYDNYIVDFFRQTNTLILYKFVDHDIYWNVTGSLLRIVDWEAENATGIEYIVADEDYIGGQLELMKEKFFKYYSVEFLKKMLPKKILLTERFGYLYIRSYIHTWYPYDCYSGNDYLIFSWGGERVAAITAAEKNSFKNTSTEVFLKRISDNGMLEKNDNFFSFTNYVTPGATDPERWANGILAYADRTQAADWVAYIRMITSTPYSKLTDEGGFLHSDRDTKGVIRKKYDVITSHFRDKYGIDLQSIGNDMEI